jgi:hypothetical protein
VQREGTEISSRSKERCHCIKKATKSIKHHITGDALELNHASTKRFKTNMRSMRSQSRLKVHKRKNNLTKHREETAERIIYAMTADLKKTTNKNKRKHKKETSLLTNRLKRVYKYPTINWMV